MTLTVPPTHVAIIGGGLAGITLALTLHDLSIPATIYESRAEDHDQGGGVVLSPNALRVLDSVGVYQRVREHAFQLDVLAFKDVHGNTTDEYYFGSEKLYGYPAIRIMRKKLLDELKTMLRERKIDIHHNSRLTTIDESGSESVRLMFANGQSASASLVIGADGIHSTVRKSFLPQVKPIFSGFLGINSVVPREKLRIPEGYHLPSIVTGKHGAFLLVPQKPDGSELFIGSQRRFADLGQEGWQALRNDKARLYDMLQENKQDWPDVVQSALEATPVEQMGFWAFHGIPPLASWLSESKRIILVGDAAHAIPPTVAQGANQAFEDVRSLATLLSKLSEAVPLDKAAARWQSYRQARIDKVLDLTKQMNSKRLSEAERAKMPPGAIWTDQGLTRGDGGELGWLYKPDLAEKAENWVQELQNST